jgi:hypothetical protein
MKHINLTKKLLGATVLSLSLTMLPTVLPAVAQTDTNAPTLDTTPFQETEDDPNNWGWLGLIGLLGLANLFRKPSRTYTETYREPTTTPRPD